LKQLAIVGSGPESRGLAPYNDETWDIWVFNEATLSDWCLRYTASFQMHKPNFYAAHNVKAPEYWGWLQERHDKPVYMQTHDARVPDCRVYPLEDAVALAGAKYLTSTVSQSIALAILQGYERVHIYGVQMSGTEYQYQSECFRFWIGLLRGKLGTENVKLYSGNQMFAGPLYGYDAAQTFPPEFFRERAKYLDGTWKAADKNLRGIRSKLEDKIAQREHAKAAELIGKYEDAAIVCGEAAGALAEAKRYIEFGDVADRNAYEFAAAHSQTEGDELRTKKDRFGGMVEYVWNVWQQTNNSQAQLQLKNLLADFGKLCYDAGAQMGMYQENISYVLKYDDMVKA
jgi:hypothetical protein